MDGGFGNNCVFLQERSTVGKISPLIVILAVIGQRLCLVNHAGLASTQIQWCRGGGSMWYLRKSMAEEYPLLSFQK